METNIASHALGKRILLALAIVTLIVSPWNSVDPINLPKMTVLGILSLSIFGLLMSRSSGLAKNINKKTFVLAIIFLGLLLVSSFKNSVDFGFALYGTPNRNTGILTYASLLILMIATSSIANPSFAEIFVRTLIGVGAFLSVYGILQWQGLEIFEYVNVYGSNVFSTLGNTNFHSAFMGMVASALFAYILVSFSTLKQKIFLITIFLLCILNISLSSSQGFLSLAGGISVTLLFNVFSKRLYKQGIFLSLFFAIGALFVTLAIFNVGPLASLIYDTSLLARSFYWTAAVRMLFAHPFFGVGVDGYGDWYLRYRDSAAAEYNYGLVSDSAHNIPLDISTSGGFPLLAIYFALQVLVIKRAVMIIRSGSEVNAAYLSILSAWSAYQIQSLVSINQIGIGVWGWAATGLLISFRGTDQVGEMKKSRTKKEKIGISNRGTTPEALLFSVAGLVIGAMIALPPYLAANRFYKVLQSGQIEQLVNSVELKPYDRSRYFYVSQILMENKLEEVAVPILQKGSEKYPDYFPIWSKFAENSKATPAQIEKARMELRRLDPLNPDFK
jgi:O-antigen ligase